MSFVDGRAIDRDREIDVDVAIVGSGPAGSAVAREVSRAGARVAVLEAGPRLDRAEASASAFGAMSSLYRSMGASVVVGPAPIPYVQGRMVGGSSPINGAICWRMPRDVHAEWCAADAALADALPWELLERATDAVEARLGVAPTDPAVAGPKNLLMAAGAEALGLEHRPIRRNVQGCEGLGRCMQGCPRDHKRDAEGTLLADARAAGATVVSSVEVEQLVVERGRARAVVGRATGGGRVRVRAARAVVLAASAVQTPALLIRNRIRGGPVGEHFQAHPGVSMAGRFDEPVRAWEGATQGHEVTGLRREGLKFEALGFGPALLAMRLPGVGRELARAVDDMEHWADWGAAIRATARGRVRVVAGRTVVTYASTPRDVALFRRGLKVLGEMLLAAGATELAPGVRGMAPRIRTTRELEELEREGPRRASAYPAAMTHLFGTCRMGGDAARSVVRPDFRHHVVDGLYVADSSVFPTNTGVNPQVSIMAVATLAARHVLGLEPSGAFTA